MMVKVWILPKLRRQEFSEHNGYGLQCYWDTILLKEPMLLIGNWMVISHEASSPLESKVIVANVIQLSDILLGIGNEVGG